ncbi:MAG: hypothetical protein WCA46_18560 [Actinocatenispora sp.]
MGVVVCGEEFETQLDKGCAFGVDDDRADDAAVGVVNVVEVAELGAAESAAAAGFLAHLVGDVGTGLAGLVLVERGQDAVHQLADRGVVDSLRGRDQGDAALAQVRHDDRVVVAVPRHARELVDDDHVDVALAVDPREHALERLPLGHLRSRASGLDILVDHRDTQLPCLAQTRFPLGRNGNAFRVVVGPDLAGRGHAQVDHRAGAGSKVIQRWLNRDGDVLLQFIDEVGIGAGHDTSLGAAWTVDPCSRLLDRTRMASGEFVSELPRLNGGGTTRRRAGALDV